LSLGEISYIDDVFLSGASLVTFCSFFCVFFVLEQKKASLCTNFLTHCFLYDISEIFYFWIFPLYFYFLIALDIRGCIRQCEETGCVGPKCFPHCTSSSDGELVGRPWYMQEPLYLQWKKWDCLSDCRYHCMLDREKEKELHNLDPVKYHGKWPFKRIFGMQVCSHAPYVFIWCLLCVHRSYAVLFKFFYATAL